MAKAKQSSMSLEEVLRRRAYRPVYESIPTQVKGLNLRVERGNINSPRLIKRELGRLAISGRMIAKSRAQMTRLSKAQNMRKEMVQNLALGHPGLRGIDSETDKLSLTAIPTHKIIWNAELLKESLGVAYSTIVGEDLVTTISVPLGHETSKGTVTTKKVETALKAGIRRLGFSNEELPSILHSEVVLRVDEARLGELIMADQVELLEGSGVVEETWTINTDPLRQP